MKYKVIVAGKRDFDDFKVLEREVLRFLQDYKPTEVKIVSGGAPGADALGEKFYTKYKEYGCSLEVFPAKWKEFGKAAGPIRNEEMAKYSNACICFWDGKSKGTKSMIDLAKKYNLDLKIIYI